MSNLSASTLMLTPAQAVARAAALCGMGAWPEAERLCRSILERDEDHFDALNLLGIITAQTRRTAEAARLLQRAISVKPNDAAVLCNHGNVLKELGQLDDALESYTRALQIEPADAEIHFNRGYTLQELNRLEEALASYEQALKIRPDFADAYNNGGNVLRALERPGEALASYDRALGIRPHFPEAHNNRGIALRELQRFEEALTSYERALKIQPDFIEAHNNRGLALQDLRRFDEALDSYERTLRIKPDYAEAYVNRGLLFYERNQPQAAVRSYDQAIALRPDFAAAYQNRAYAFLLAGDLANGWRDHEWRWKNELSGGTRHRRCFAQPLWLGKEPLGGRTILLHAEQGLGDTLQFCRYVELVAALGATVILEVPGPLTGLLESLRGARRLIACGDPLPAFDYHCPLMSLPLAFNTTLATIPARVPYLSADRVKVLSWQEKLGPRQKLRVGLAWSGGFRPGQPELWAVNERRNVPLSKLAPLQHPEIDFYSLQKGQPAESELAALQASKWDGPHLIDFAARLHDFSDTAALIDNLDLVIAVDTAVAHLAGAMGKPVWLMNRSDTCWRWLLDRSDSPWYPSLTLYRQAAAGDWDAVVARIRTDLHQLATTRGLPPQDH